MNKIAYIGPKEYAEAFSFLGFYCFGVDNEEEAIEKIDEIKGEFSIIIASRDILEKEIPGVVIMPGILEKKEGDYLKDVIKRAVGSDVTISAG